MALWFAVGILTVVVIALSVAVLNLNDTIRRLSECYGERLDKADKRIQKSEGIIDILDQHIADSSVIDSLVETQLTPEELEMVRSLSRIPGIGTTEFQAGKKE